jgi:hypothetical protein
MKPTRHLTVFVLPVLLISGTSLAGGGRNTAGIKFPETIESKVGDEKVKLVRTGAAVRHRGRFKVYAIASYLKQGVKARSAEELIAADAPKQLHLVMLRFVPARAMADAFQSALRQNHPQPAFAEELKTVTDLFQKASLEKGQHVRLTHVPKVGLRCERESGDILIRNVEFSKAIWEIYFGKMNVEEAVRRGLISDL